MRGVFEILGFYIAAAGQICAMKIHEVAPASSLCMHRLVCAVLLYFSRWTLVPLDRLQVGLFMIFLWTNFVNSGSHY